jgi:hypothetical protein
MMTPKQKADELVNKYLTSRDANQLNDVRDIHSAIRCALIAVNEMIEIRNEIINTLKLGALDIEVIAFLEEVKQEIENK